MCGVVEDCLWSFRIWETPLNYSQREGNFIPVRFFSCLILILFFCLFGIRNRIFPTGSTPKGGPTEFTLYHPGHSSPPGLVSVSVPSPPILLSWMRLASGPYSPLSSCPIHIPYLVSGLFLPCLSVLHIYSNPTEKNTSTYFKPHKQTVLIHYLNNQNT